MKKIILLLLVSIGYCATYPVIPHTFYPKKVIPYNYLNDNYNALLNGITDGTSKLNISQLYINGILAIDSDRSIELGTINVTGDMHIEGNLSVSGNVIFDDAYITATGLTAESVVANNSSAVELSALSLTANIALIQNLVVDEVLTVNERIYAPEINIVTQTVYSQQVNESAIDTLYVDMFETNKPIINFGNGKDGIHSSSEYTTMGGEYWFDGFNINSSITVSDSIGWLIIRANTITISAVVTINGKGKSLSPIGLANNSVTDPPLATVFYGIGLGYSGMAGTAGSGSASSYPTGGTAVGAPSSYWGIYESIYGRTYLLGGASGATGADSGNNGNNGYSMSTKYGIDLIFNPINFGQSSGGSSKGFDDSSGDADNRDGVNGVKGGAGIAIYAKKLVVNANMVIDSSGMNGNAGLSSSWAASGSSGGGGAGSNLVCYTTKTGSGTITQLALGGVGAGRVGSPASGGAGGNGGNGIKVLYDITNNTITVN